MHWFYDVHSFLATWKKSNINPSRNVIIDNTIHTITAYILNGAFLRARVDTEAVAVKALETRPVNHLYTGKFFPSETRNIKPISLFSNLFDQFCHRGSRFHVWLFNVIHNSQELEV